MVEKKEKKPLGVITAKEAVEIFLQAGSCRIEIGKDEKGRFTLTPVCPADETGQPVLSEQAKVLNDILRSAEVVLKPPKMIEEVEGGEKKE